ncbi:MAG: regulatory protein MarR [Bacteroidetes bacterium]|nr:regulatory protein MarR [Bacteroidota bacterium]
MSKNIDRTSIQAISDLGRKFSDATVLMHDAVARRIGLASADHKYLGILMQNGSMTAGELSRRTGLTTGAVTGLTDRLEKKKLVKREADKKDRRKIMIVPNHENAAKLFGNVLAGLQNKMVNLMAKLPQQEKEIIERYMLSIIDIMNEVTVDLRKSGKRTGSKK